MFVLTANLIGIGPWKAFEPLFKSMGWTVQGEAFEITSPTTDINCVFALTIVSIVTYLVAGFFINGAPKFINSYFNPLNPHFYLELLDLIIRPTTLTLRLMLVISADEILRGVALQMVPFLAPSAVMAFEMCIALIQAFVFAVLTSIYIGLTLQEH
jgi:F-type H+-transporting ATPase subunit a